MKLLELTDTVEDHHGVVVGTYASIFIATPIMYDVTKKADAKKAAK